MIWGPGPRLSAKNKLITPGPFTVEVRMEKPVGLHGSRLRPILGEKVKLGYRASKCRKTDRESLTWK